MADARIWETAFEAYPPKLLDLLGPMIDVPLSEQDLVAIGQATPGFLRALDREGTQPVGFSDAFRATVEGLLPRADGAPVFPRTGIASFKSGGPPTPVFTPQDLYRVMRRPNPRLVPFLLGMITEGHPATLFLRPYLPLLSWGEFRVFVLNGQVMGVSQHPVRRICPEIRTYEAQIRAALRSLFLQVVPALHLAHVVLDVGLTVEKDVLRAHLLELNPAIRRTDPGLFDWTRPEGFDRSFRYL